MRRLRCCESDQTAWAEPAALELLNPTGVEATQLFNDKKLKQAAALALKMLDLAPNHRAALRVLFEIRKSENQAKATEMLARRLAALPPENPTQGAAAQLQLAQWLVGVGRHQEAEAACRAALKLSPRDATIHHVMGVILTETGRLRAGEAHYRAALRDLDREDGMMLANLAWNVKLQGRMDEAAATYERALLLRPDNARGIGGFAQVEAARGRLDRAAALLDEALGTWPGDRTLRLLRALVDLQAGRPAAVLDRLDGALEGLLPAELLLRGQALARLDQPAEATALYALGKRMQRERHGQAYAPEAVMETAAAYRKYFTADQLLSLPRAAPLTGVQPVFLLGFPRSGTALLEQFLSKTPGFVAADGFAPVADLVALLPALTGAPAAGYPEALGDTLVGEGLDVPNVLQRRYFEQLAAAGIQLDGAAYVTDRSANNHWHLGLIKLLFADAPIIHVIRHPYDVVLANFAQDRRLEANCGVSLMALARHYDFTMRLIQHFRGQLTLRYLPVRYEDLVDRPAETLGEVLAFIGADQRPREFTLRANDPPSGPILPTHAILRETLHGRGRYKYRAYEAVMANLFSEVRPVLKPWIDELGYGDAA